MNWSSPSNLDWFQNPNVHSTSLHSAGVTLKLVYFVFGQEPNPECVRGGPCDVPWVPSSNSTNRTYSTNIEAFTIRFSHFFQARQFFLNTRNDYFSQAGSEMKGKLVDIQGNTMAQYGNDAADIISLAKILEAANVDIDDLSAYPPAAEANETNRYVFCSTNIWISHILNIWTLRLSLLSYAGLVLFFGIDYRGNYDNPVEYTYSVTQVPAVEYKVTRSTIVNFNSRLITDTHGIKIFFVFSGSICRFDFQTMLINMVAGLGLLSLATLTTDFVMEYLTPLKNAYIRYKYKETAHHDQLLDRMETRKLSELLETETSRSEMDSVSVNRKGPLSQDKSADRSPYHLLSSNGDGKSGNNDSVWSGVIRIQPDPMRFDIIMQTVAIVVPFVMCRRRSWSLPALFVAVILRCVP